MKSSLLTDEILAPLKKANAQLQKHYPGEPHTRQAVHTVYGGAHLFKFDTAAKMGDFALNSLKQYAPDAVTLAKALGYSANPDFAQKVYTRVEQKLKREAVEDFRIDFEDGFGNRPDAEEDFHAAAAATEVAKGLREKTLPPFVGIRIKTFTDELVHRSARTLEIFVTTLVEQTQGKLPSGFVITTPKVMIPEQVTTLVRLLEALEKKLKLPAMSLKFELMIEVTQAIFGADGRTALPLLLQASEGRCTGAHFGTYDYTASCNITAAHQRMSHLACDFAKHMMQISYSNTGIMISDGATNVMPVGPHKASAGQSLAPTQLRENTEIVHRAWKLSYDHIRHSLEGAFYQGWDLHPAQLPVRYAALYSFFLEGAEAASARLRAFMDKAAQATLLGDVFDDAATGQGLLNYFLRGLSCGAITESEALATGLTIPEIQSRSFLRILQGRKK